MASTSAAMERPFMESDSDGQRIAVILDRLKSLSPELRRYKGEFRNSSFQIPADLNKLSGLLDYTKMVVEDAEQWRDNIMVKSLLAELKEVLCDPDFIIGNINDAYTFGLFPEVQSSANKPWETIRIFFNRISRFRHYYREKRTVSKVKYITVELEEILGEGKQLLVGIPDERTQSGIQSTLTMPVIRDLLESLSRELETYKCEFQNSSFQIPEELTILSNLLNRTKVVVEDAKRCRDNITVKSWLAELKEVLCDPDFINYAYIFRPTAAVQSSANKPWETIRIFLNRISRFMHSYREKRMVSKVKDIAVELREILIGLVYRVESTSFGIEHTLTMPGDWLVLVFLHKDVRIYLRKLRKSSNQIPKELTKFRRVLKDTIGVAEDFKRYRDDIMVKIWIAEMEAVLYDTRFLFWEIKNANVFRQTAEVQSSANKPWKLILNLFNKISRFMHYYREKKTVSKLKDVTSRLKEIIDEGKQLLKEIRGGRTQTGLQSRLTTPGLPDRQNPGKKQFVIAMRDPLWKVEDFFGSNRHPISTTFENGQTALHIAITAGQLRIAKELITSTSEAKRKDLKKKDESGNTALSLAARSGMMEIAKCLIEKDYGLLTIPNGEQKLPVQLACRAGHEDVTRYLYRYTSQTWDPDNTSKKVLDGDYGFDLLENCITKKMFDIALHLLYSFPKFGIYSILTKRNDICPIIMTLAQTQPPFFRRNQLSFWRRWKYNYTRVKIDKGSVLSDDVDFVAAQRGRAKKIYDLKLMDVIARKIIHLICWQLSALDENEFLQSGAVKATFEAIKNGLPEIAIEIANVNPNIFWYCSDHEDSSNMFACAVKHRQEQVAQFLYGSNASIGTNMVFTADKDGNNLLHLAAKLAPSSHLDYISGAALQLQSELRWFKAVGGIVPQFYNHQKNHVRETPSQNNGGETPSQNNGGQTPSQNNGGQTPSQLFVNEHKQLLKEAEEWVKKTAESSTVVGTLIITIMFAVAFTVPGGNDQNTGFPIFLKKTTDSSTVPSPTVPFMVFVVSDAISLFAASSSVLMFLGIRASRYAYEDFFKSLPVKLIIGISSLFISIAAMMVAFCVALFIMLQGHLWIIIPVILLAGIPIIIFVLSLSPFLVELYTLTFGPDIFDRKRTTAWEKEEILAP